MIAGKSWYRLCSFHAIREFIVVILILMALAIGYTFYKIVMNEKEKNIFSSKKILNILLNERLITVEQKEEIEKTEERAKLALGKKKSGPAGLVKNSITIVDVVASLNLIRADKKDRMLDEDLIFQVLAKNWKVPYMKIDPLKMDLNTVTTTIPRSFAKKHLLIPVGVKDGYLTIATSNPFNREAMEDITRVSHTKVKIFLSSKSDIIRLIDEFFGFKSSIAAAEVEFASPGVDLGNLEQYVRITSADELPSNDHHIIKAVNHIFSYAIDQRASDIHIEPKREKSVVRMRIDGMLHTVYKLPVKVHLAIISRIKNLSRMDMAEKRRPQDGRIKTDKGGVEVEIRVSTVPVAFGEKVVMRIMDPDILFQDLENLGFSRENLSRYKKFVGMPHGIVLVCGPTGSGKSTTLYSTLREISTPKVNITTVEDPIEMIHEEFNQIAVQPGVDITFGSILRTILRQDPDIIMIGEMRDLETAENAVQAAMTGHLVLSTLHTNDAPSSIIRLLDLGIPYFLIQATLVGVVSQRLVRKICPYCKESFTMDSSRLKELGLDVGRKGAMKIYRGRGCVRCRETGYLGRSGIFEILSYTESIRRLTTQNADFVEIKTMAEKEGMTTLRQDAVRNLLKGETTFEEVLRVTWQAVP